MAALGKLRDLMLRKIELQFFKIVFEINYAVLKNAKITISQSFWYFFNQNKNLKQQDINQQLLEVQNNKSLRVKNKMKISNLISLSYLQTY